MVCFAKTKSAASMPWLSRWCSIFLHSENPLLLGPSLSRLIGPADSEYLPNGNRCWLEKAGCSRENA